MGPCDLGHVLGGAASGPRVNGLSVLQSRDLLTTPPTADQGGNPSGGKESVPQRVRERGPYPQQFC